MKRALLVVESAGAIAEGDLRAALAPLPVDEVRVVARIPRDPRHASETDTAVLRRELKLPPG